MDELVSTIHHVVVVIRELSPSTCLSSCIFRKVPGSSIIIIIIIISHGH